MTSPCGPEAVALLTALNDGDDSLAVELIADFDPSTLATVAVVLGHAVLHGWHDLAVLVEADPKDFVATALARSGFAEVVT